jgi:hypothetical protein
MRTLYAWLTLCGVIIGFASCKKEAKPQIPIAITGKWYVQQYTLTSLVNGTSSTSTATPTGWFTDSDYYQLNANGSGIESHADPSIGKQAFTFQVLNSNVFLSRPLTLLGKDTCSYSMPSSNQLILKTGYTETSTTGNVYKVTQEVDLSK